MRDDIEAWIGKDEHRRQVYQTDPLYHAQAQVLSTTLDAIEVSLLATLPRNVVAPAMVAAVTAILGSTEAAEERARQIQEQIRIETYRPKPSHWWDLPGGPLSKEQGGGS